MRSWTAKVGIQKSGDDLTALAIAELTAAVPGPWNENQLNGKFQSFVSLCEFLGLLRRHLRIGSSVDEEKRGISLVEVCHGTGEFREFRLFVGVATQQKLQ